MTNFFGFLLTIIVYIFSKFLFKFFKKIPVVVLAGLILIFVLQIFKIDYEVYNKSAKYLTYLLAPATIALGYSIYKNIDLLKTYKRIIYPAFLVSSLVSVLSVFVIVQFFSVDLNLLFSFLPKSITAPIAIEISKITGGIVELTICTVVLTGIFGGLFGYKILKLFKIKNSTAIGISIGSSSHIIGTSKCIEKGNEVQIAMSSVSIVFVGIISSILIPLFVFFFG